MPSWMYTWAIEVVPCSDCIEDRETDAKLEQERTDEEVRFAASDMARVLNLVEVALASRMVGEMPEYLGGVVMRKNNPELLAEVRDLLEDWHDGRGKKTKKYVAPTCKSRHAGLRDLW